MELHSIYKLQFTVKLSQTENYTKKSINSKNSKGQTVLLWRII